MKLSLPDEVLSFRSQFVAVPSLNDEVRSTYYQLVSTPLAPCRHALGGGNSTGNCTFVSSFWKQCNKHTYGSTSSLLFSCFTILEQACFSTAWGSNPCKHRAGAMVDSHRGAGTRRGLCDYLVFREGVTTRRNGSHSVVLYHSLEYPKADHLINRWVVGRAKRLRVARRPLSPAERKKESFSKQARERERHTYKQRYVGVSV